MTQDEKKQFGDRLNDIESKLNRVLYILESDDKTNSKGLVERVLYTEKTVEEMKRERDILKAQASTWGVIGGAVITAGAWILQKIIAKGL